MRNIFLILVLLINSFAYSQKTLSYIGRQILVVDSAIIYTSPKTSTTILSDSSCCNMFVYKDSFQIVTKLTLKARTELGNALIKPNNYAGRYASRSGFDPTEILALWKKGKVEYLKISRQTHKIFYSRNSKLIIINPFDVDKLEMFYKKYKIRID